MVFVSISSSLTCSVSHSTSRKVLDLSQTASLVREPGHICAQVDEEITKVKMDVRIAMTYQRFLLEEQMGIQTTRNKTIYNGSVAHCKHRCEAAHASLSPNLYGKDLINSTTNYLRNSTFENSVSSNRVDSYVEKTLRGLEDNLAQACSAKEITSEEAMTIFLEEYIHVLTPYQEELGTTLVEFKLFLELETTLKKLNAGQEIQYDLFVGQVRKLISLKNDLLAKKGIGIALGKVVSSFHSKRDWALLEILIANDNRDQILNDFERFRNVWKKAPKKINSELIETDLANRSKEVQVQLEEVTKFRENVFDLLELYYGLKNPASGERRMPNQEELKIQLTHQFF